MADESKEQIPFAKIAELREQGQQQVATAGDTPPAAAAATDPPASAPAFDENKWLSEKFGDKFKTFDELTAAVNKPAEVQFKAPEFPNDDSKLLYENILGGEEDKVLDVLVRRKQAKAFPTLSDDEKIAAHIRIEYPSLSDSQVRREIEKRYGFDATGMDDEDKALEETKIKDRKTRDALQATEYFTKNTQEIKFPSAPKPTTQTQQLSDQQKQFMEMGVSYSADKIGEEFSYEFIAPEKNITVKGKVTLPGDKITELEQQIATDPNFFLAGYLDRYLTPENKVNARMLAKDIILHDDPASWAKQIAKTTTEEVFTARLAQERNRDGTAGGTGSPGVATPEQTERDRMYDAFKVPKAASNGASAPVA